MRASSDLRKKPSPQPSPKGRGGRKRRRSLATEGGTTLKLLVVAGSLGLLFGPSVAAHVKRGADPEILNDDARVYIPPMFRFAEPGLFPDDLIAEYHLDGLPAGYRLLYRTLALVADPAIVSRALPYVLWLAMLAAIGAAAWRIGGAATAWVALALCLSAGVFLDRMIGGTPRAFSFPVVAVATAGLVFGRPMLTAAMAVVGAATYPVSGVIAGLSLAAYLLVLPAGDRGPAAGWSLGRRLVVLAITATVAGATVLPVALRLGGYGPIVRAADAAELPEAGPHGRYGPDDRAPFRGLAVDGALVAHQAFLGAGPGWFGPMTRAVREPLAPRVVVVAAMTLVAGYGLVVLARRRVEGRRLLCLLAAAVVGYIVACPLAPYFYLPQRYAIFPLPILLIVGFAGGATALAAWLARRFAVPSAPSSGERGPEQTVAPSGSHAVPPSLRPSVTPSPHHPVSASLRCPAATLAIAGLCLLLIGGRGSPEVGWDIDTRPEQELYAFLRTLPQDAVIAGWPEGPVDNVPFVCRRSVLLSYQTHQAFHRGYVLATRRRMEAIIDAVFAMQARPIRRLRDEFGVTHLVVDVRLYGPEPPTYFEPFRARIDERWHDAVRQGPATLAFRGHAAFDDGFIFVLDLGRLPGPDVGP